MRSVEKAREVRLWIVQVIAPATIAGCILWTNPEVKYFLKDKTHKIKTKIKELKERI